MWIDDRTLKVWIGDQAHLIGVLRVHGFVSSQSLFCLGLQDVALLYQAVPGVCDNDMLLHYAEKVVRLFARDQRI